MSQEPIEPSSTSPAPAAQPAASPSSLSSAAAVALIAAAGLVLSFFLPWAKLILGITVSGLDLSKEAMPYPLLWSLPLSAGICAVSILANRRSKPAEIFAGALPFICLVIFLQQYGADVFKTFDIGAWLALIAGGILFGVPHPKRP